MTLLTPHMVEFHMDVGDRIRSVKRNGQSEIHWTKSEWKALLDYMDEAGFEFKDTNYFWGVRHINQDESKL